MKEYVLVYMVEPFVQVPFTMWPLHMTVLPWFEAPNDEAAIESLRQAITPIAAFDITVGEPAAFGRHTVDMIMPSKELQALHEALRTTVLNNGWPLRGRHTGKHYTPHVTRKGGRQAEGTLHIGAIHIVESLPMMYRRPVAAIMLQ